jgi:CMP-N-acetylneuraminic acid synthetase
MHNVATVILARSKYSKRIPNKPMVKFVDRPLIDWTSEFAVKLGYPVWVYTDNDDVAKIAGKRGCNVREKQLESKEGVHRTSEELTLYNKEIKADYIILLQVTSPLRIIEDYLTYIKYFFEDNYDCGFAAHQFNKYIYDSDAKLLNHNNRGYNKNVDSYFETGAFYIFKKEQLQKKHITDGRCVLFSDRFDIDIDTYADLAKAEMLYVGGYYEDEFNT